MLHHLISWPREMADPPHPCLVLIHGRGSDEQDLFGLVPELPRRPLVISVRAPFPFPWGGYFWYDLTNDQGVPDQPTLDDSAAQLLQLLRELPAKYQADPARIFLLGFSQGALMSGLLLLEQPQQVAGAIMLSGYLPPLETTADVTGKPVFQAHGSYDSVLPVVLAREARFRLESLNAAVEYHEYPMDHQVSPEELNDLRAWFERLGLV